MQQQILIVEYINTLPCNDVRRRFTSKLREVMKEYYPEHKPFTDRLFVSTLDNILESVKN